ncbi:ATP-binding response regulator [Polaromonas sp. AET17H-212]|uniref:ATP-binding response regulator n=1 Tax=Polaromonas sp. AET17H-212 TaxID=1977061 RepID=UPI000BBBA000|nr:ATP-binding protein [Polaromonas sp. AET17H-212]
MRQDRRISLIGGIIFLVTTLTAGIAVYAVMERQTESVLSRGLQAALQSNVRLFESQTHQALTDARTAATRPFLVQTLQILGSTPDDAAATLAMQRAATSFLSTGFNGLSFHDARGREVARAGSFSRGGEQHVLLSQKDHAVLLWNGKFIVQTHLDILDPQGLRVGEVRTEVALPLLTRVFGDVAAIGQSAEFAICAPLDDGKDMNCFLGRVSGIEFKRLARVVEGKALPMNHALLGKTGIIVARDYRREQVVAAYTPIAPFAFGMVLKIDQKELYAPILAQLKYILPLLAALAIVGMLLLNVLVAPLVRKLVLSEKAARDANALLRNNETQLRDITDTLPALLAYVDAEQRFRFHNRAYEEALGLSSEQIEGKHLREVLGEKIYQATTPQIEQVMAGYPVVYERTRKNPRGDPRDYVVNYFPRYGEGEDEGRVIGFYSMATDVTELKRLDRIKSEFVSTVSHELRTPLTSIRGSLGLIAGGVAGQVPDAVKSLVEIAKNNCERLIRLINDILDIEKIESGQMQLDLQELALKPLLVQALAANEGFGAAKNVHLKLFCTDEPLHVRADSDRLTQVVTNLLSNAMKFSSPGGTVEVHVSRAGLGVRVEVRDRGPGIPDEFRKRIFQKFSQADSSDTRQNSGTGLGLNISRAIIERLGGTMGFESDASTGTTFFFELPQSPSPQPGNLPVATPAASTTKPAGVRPRILVCEDDRDIAHLIGLMLEKGGFDVDRAYTAATALAFLEKTSYAAMTVDLGLPDQDGITLVLTLRRQAHTRNLPIVVVSASASEERIECNSLPLEVSDWLDKPIDENQLVLALRHAIGSMAEGKPRILHVEDDVDIQRITAAIAQDFAVFEFAASPEEARARLHEQHFDLVLLDLALRGGSGWEVLADVEALDQPPPVVVFSATALSRAEADRFAAVLVKAQTSNAEVLQTLQRVLAETHPAGAAPA